MAKPSKSNLRFIKDPAMNLITSNWMIIVTLLKNQPTQKQDMNIKILLDIIHTLGGCLEAIARDDAKSESYNSLREFVERFEAKSKELKNIIKL
jgi:hypothetical protein